MSFENKKNKKKQQTKENHGKHLQKTIKKR